MKKICLIFTMMISVYSYADSKPLRVAVIGGMTMSGLWEEVSKAFEKKYGIKTELVITGNKSVLKEYCLDKPVDLITMHSSDTVSNLASLGLIEQLTPWVHNSQMIVFDKSNTAHLDQTDSLATVLKKISDSGSTFIVHLSGGTFEVFHRLSSQYAFKPKIVFTQKSNAFFSDVVSHHGYTLFGVIPYLMKKHYNPYLKGFIVNDAALHRPYLAAVGAENRIGKERHKNAELLLAFLVSPEVQNIIRHFRIESFSDVPVFFPRRSIYTRKE